MNFFSSWFKKHGRDYLPMSIACLQEGYSVQRFLNDLLAGISVGIIALPLALAFAIGSNVEPEQGLYTAIIAGFLISLLGGSKVQIGGPTGAFVVIVYSIVQRHGYEGLAIATLIAAVLLILMGLARLGVLLKFIPYSVTTGFTTGLALVIFMSQVKDFLGLDIENPSPKFLEKCRDYCLFADTWNIWAFSISIVTLLSLIQMRRYFPRFPGAIFVIGLVSAVAYFFDFPVETIESKFGEIPASLPTPSLPDITLEKIKTMFPDAITVALLGAIESLLCAVIADGVTGHKHRSNCELVAQGLANFGSVLFKGIPATGAIARTSANIRLGATSPLSGMVHAVTLLLLMILFAPMASKIPLATLAAVLVFVAWNMAELPNFIKILKGERQEAGILVITFLLTVLVDLTVAVQVGVVLSAMLFLKKMTDNGGIEICRTLLKENAHEAPEKEDSEILLRHDVPSDVAIFELKGPFFYTIAHMLDDALLKLDEKPRVFILRMRHVTLIDATALNALEQFAKRCKKEKIKFLISGLKPEILDKIHKKEIDKIIGEENLFPHVNTALAYAKSLS